MSSIEIICRKDVGKENVEGKNDKYRKCGNELWIEAKQLFMNTKEFYRSIEPMLKEYFDSINKK